MDTATVVAPAELHAEVDNLSREMGRSEDELVTEARKEYVLRYRRSRFSSLGAAESGPPEHSLMKRRHTDSRSSTAGGTERSRST